MFVSIDLFRLSEQDTLPAVLRWEVDSRRSLDFFLFNALYFKVIWLITLYFRRLICKISAWTAYVFPLSSALLQCIVGGPSVGIFVVIRDGWLWTAGLCDKLACYHRKLQKFWWKCTVLGCFHFTLFSTPHTCTCWDTGRKQTIIQWYWAPVACIHFLGIGLYQEKWRGPFNDEVGITIKWNVNIIYPGFLTWGAWKFRKGEASMAATHCWKAG